MTTFMKILGDISTSVPQLNFRGDRPLLSPLSLRPWGHVIGGQPRHWILLKCIARFVSFVITANSYTDLCFVWLFSRVCCRGEFTVEDETYSVEPVDNTLSGRHRVYRESDNLQPAGVCGRWSLSAAWLAILCNILWMAKLWRTLCTSINSLVVHSDPLFLVPLSRISPVREGSPGGCWETMVEKICGKS